MDEKIIISIYFFILNETKVRHVVVAEAHHVVKLVDLRLHTVAKLRVRAAAQGIRLRSEMKQIEHHDLKRLVLGCI